MSINDWMIAGIGVIFTLLSLHYKDSLVCFLSRRLRKSWTESRDLEDGLAYSDSAADNLRLTSQPNANVTPSSITRLTATLGSEFPTSVGSTTHDSPRDTPSHSPEVQAMSIELKTLPPIGLGQD
ncbi:hypothetical protein EJ02DRAFT_219674 [Clathrospora elynae]|uniref:Uncharacterized protein n=1 Tax=Clathrospora elynae TaxID=706981 RepID=A0A6A5SL37_9PLEO|nr:hypothetical protein EJ02DRAFT_219674 [Clathrospora elynae]